LEEILKQFFVEKMITALLIAGGRNGVLTIFNKLHIRDLKRRKAKPDEARTKLQACKENIPQ
jgi:hypothetical protein